MKNITEDLPVYSIRVSERARRISLNFSVERGLELVIPSLRHERKALEFLRSQQKWVSKKLAQYQTSSTTLAWPSELILPAIQQSWHLIYQESSCPGITVLAEANTLIIRYKFNDFFYVRDLLEGFVRQLAELELSTRLSELSYCHQLNYQRVSFGSHKTQWGSCSPTGRISLNIQLLFLKPDVVDYVLVHELCHTKHLNHSKRFWALVEKCLPNYHQQRLELRHAKRLVPFWLLNSKGQLSKLRPSAELRTKELIHEEMPFN